MDKIIGVVGSVPSTKSRNDDDFTDRLSHRFTSALLILFAIIVSSKQYVGEPIQCWVPAHFTGSHESYANSYCWVKNTYYLPFEEYIPGDGLARNHLPYYQWVPLILLLQALFFYMPIMIWRTLNARAGVDLNNIVESGETFANLEKAEARDKTMEYMTNQMDRYLTSQREYATSCSLSLKTCLSNTLCLCCGRRKGNYLTVLYLFTKVIFIINVLAQLFLLNHFLGQQFHLYGIDVLSDLIRGADWRQSDRFPRVTMCDFKVRRLGNIQRYTVQCVLPINLFNEMIYLFLWFWLVLVSAMSCYSLLSWTIRSMSQSDRFRYIKKHLTLMDALSEKGDKELARKFTQDFLRHDGVLIMRLVGFNTNDITATEFINSVFDKYKKREQGYDEEEEETAA